MHLEMFKFLGALMAMAFRSGHNIMLRLPSLFWKNFIGEEVTIDDLEEIDAYAVQGIKELENIKSWGSKEEFDECIDLRFTTILSNGKSVPLVENGENIKVTFDSIDKYKQKVLKTRANEARRQMDAIREGFETNVPIFALMFLSSKNVEQRV